ncbi:MAG: hypothetical protein WDM80_14655 [Limisphaerales bacterium]
MPIFYECQRCTACCRWPGQVRLADVEITRLAAAEKFGHSLVVVALYYFDLWQRRH